MSKYAWLIDKGSGAENVLQIYKIPFLVGILQLLLD